MSRDLGTLKPSFHCYQRVGCSCSISTSSIYQSDICQKLKRYLSWMGFRTKVFNVGSRRRQVAKEELATEEIVKQVEQTISRQASDRKRSPLATTVPELPEELPEETANGTAGAPSSAAAAPKIPLTVDVAASWGPSAPYAPADTQTTSSPISDPRRSSLPVPSSPTSTQGGSRPKPPRVPIRSRTKSGASIAIRQTEDNKEQLTAHHDAAFFDPSNQEANKKREEIAMDALEEILEWLKSGTGKVAIHDATNTTLARRWGLLGALPPGVTQTF